MNPPLGAAVFVLLGCAVSNVSAQIDSPSAQEAISLVQSLGGDVRRPEETGPVQEVDLIGCEQITAEVLGKLHAFVELGTLILRRSNLNDSHLAALSRFEQLSTLDISGTKVTDAGMSQVRAVERLTRLWIHNNREITDRGVRQLESLTGLTELNVKGTGITDNSLQSIAKLTNLVRLTLDDTNVSDAGIAKLSALEKLESLTLDRTRVSDAGLARIANYRSLKVLSLSGTKVTDASIPSIAKLENLIQLEIDKSTISAAGAKQLQMVLGQGLLIIDKDQHGPDLKPESILILGDDGKPIFPRLGTSQGQAVEKAVAPSTTTPMPPAHIRALIRALGSEQFKEREEAEQRLKTAGKEAIAALAAAVESDDLEVRNRALRVLAAMADKYDAAVAPTLVHWLRLLTESENEAIRRQAALALGRQFDRERAAIQAARPNDDPFAKAPPAKAKKQP